MITFHSTGEFNKLTKFLEKSVRLDPLKRIEKYGRKGVDLLSSATPVRTGLTARSWSYRVTKDDATGNVTLAFYNSNTVGGNPIAILIQVGHATRNGGWVEGRDYINPAIQPLFDELAKKVWKEVTRN